VSDEEHQVAAPYPADFLLAVKPDEVAPYNCDHDEVICECVHDWRIHWGNVPRKTAARATYLT
jgi:hypothetical protein